MDETQTRPELSQAELPPNRKEQVPATTPSRKRPRIEDDEPQPKRARLTRKNLAQLDKMGRKKIPDSTDESGSTKTTSTTSTGFDVKADKNGILEPIRSKRPTNYDDTVARYDRARGTASPPESVYKEYVRKIETAGNEATVTRHMTPLFKEYDAGYYPTANKAFTAFPKGVGFNDGLSAPQPDLVEGLQRTEFAPFPIDDINGAVLFDDDRFSTALPHLAGEWKSRRRSSMKEAKMQSSYDGAALVYGRNQALAYLGTPDPPGHSAVTTFTTDGENLNLFGHYAAPSGPKEQIQYHQYPITNVNLLASYEDFKQGRKQLRNAQDDAREQSYALRDQLKEHWKQQRSTLNPIAEGAPLPAPEVETTQRGDEADYEIVEQPCPPTPAASSGLRKASRSNSSSKVPPFADDYAPGSSQKRKASLSPGSSSGSSRHHSKYRNYWKKDTKSGRYYHRHSDGTVSWLDDGHNGDGY